MSQPSAPAPVTRRRRLPKWAVWTLWGLLGVVLAVLLVAFVTAQFGAVHGIEMNPYSFERRTYSFYEIPLIRVQVLGIRRNPVTDVTQSFLATNKYVTTKNVPDVWHIVQAAKGVRAPKVGDAEILVHYLETKDAKDYHLWVKWSEANPKLAAIFWPAVSRLAQEELYIYIPDLFDLAKGASDPVALKSQLDKVVSVRLFELGRQLQDVEEHAEAVKYFKEAEKLDPENSFIKRAREKSASLAPAAPADAGKAKASPGKASK